MHVAIELTGHRHPSCNPTLALRCAVYTLIPVLLNAGDQGRPPSTAPFVFRTPCVRMATMWAHQWLRIQAPSLGITASMGTEMRAVTNCVTPAYRVAAFRHYPGTTLPRVAFRVNTTATVVTNGSVLASPMCAQNGRRYIKAYQYQLHNMNRNPT
jgi:hypothetical protein